MHRKKWRVSESKTHKKRLQIITYIYLFTKVLQKSENLLDILYFRN